MMMKKARIKDGVAVDVSLDPENHFHPEIAAAFVDVPAEVETGWRLDPETGTWSAPVVMLTPAPASIGPTRITRLAYMRRFKISEEAGIRTAGKTDAVVEVILARLDAASYVDLADTATKEGLDYLVAQGLLTEARAAEILTAAILDDELPE